MEHPRCFILDSEKAEKELRHFGKSKIKKPDILSKLFQRYTQLEGHLNATLLVVAGLTGFWDKDAIYSRLNSSSRLNFKCSSAQ